MPGVSGLTGVGTGAASGAGGAGAAAGGGGMPYGMILGGVGGILSTWAASKEAKEMYDTYLKEVKRQGQYQQQAYGAFGQNLAATGATGYGNMMEQGSKGREQLYAGMQQTPLTLSPFPSSAPYAARDAATAQLAGQQRAALGGYQDAAFGTGLSNQATNRQLAEIGNYSQGMSDIFPYRMYDAQNSAWQIALAGQLLSSMGSLSTDVSSHFKDYAPPQGASTPGTGGSQAIASLGGGGGGGGITDIYNLGMPQRSPWGGRDPWATIV